MLLRAIYPLYDAAGRRPYEYRPAGKVVPAGQKNPRHFLRRRFFAFLGEALREAAVF